MKFDIYTDSIGNKNDRTIYIIGKKECSPNIFPVIRMWKYVSADYTTISIEQQQKLVMIEEKEKDSELRKLRKEFGSDSNIENKLDKQCNGENIIVRKSDE